MFVNSPLKLLVSLCLLTFVWSLDLEKCVTRPLGMESGEITDQQISASSSFDSQSVGPQNARIRTEVNSGAWCPKAQIRNGSYEYLQVNFNSTFVIRSVETQGRYGNGTGREFATAYLIEYWRSGVSKWIRYQNRNGAQLVEANSDTITAVLRDLDPPLVASKIRIIPYSVQTRTTCLRAEFYGCQYKDGLLSYALSALPASSNSQEDFTDETFENLDDLDPIFKTPKGLGLLTDGDVPKHPPIDVNFRLPFRNSTWLAWTRNDTDGKVQMHFNFDQKRLITQVEVFGFGSPPVRLVEVEFLVDDTNGMDFGHKVSTKYPEDLTGNQVMEQKHYSIRIPLNQNTQVVKLTFNFQSDWLYLSEIRFRTDSNDGISLLHDFSLNNEDYGLYYILVAVLSVLFILLTTALCVLISIRKRRSPKSEKSLISSLSSPSSRSTAGTSLSRELKSHHYPNGTLVTTLPFGSAIGHQPRHVIHSHSFAQNQGFLSQHKGNLFVATEKRLLGVTPASRSCSGGTLFNSMNRDQPPSLLDINFPPPPPSSNASTTRADHVTTSNSSSEGIYAEPCSTAPLLPNHQSRHRNNHTRRPIPKPRSKDSLTRRNRTLPTRTRPYITEPEESHYAVAHISSSESTATSPRPFIHHHHFQQQNGQLEPLLNDNKRYIRRANVQLVEKIGEGKFTHIYSCRLRNEETGETKWAALKRLYQDNEASRLALISEAQKTNDLEHPNINRLLGQCEDLSLVTELCANGDLRSYCLKERQNLSLSQMLGFCAEIATAMMFLEERGIIHGHLSPKSILLTENKQVKVSSARGANHHAQLRYSAPEAIVLNVWSSQSDAYSYGMTAWEILNFCDQTPYQLLTNSQMIDNARQLLEGSPAIYPELPADSPLKGEIEELLRECWSYPSELRPGFREMQVFMSRKQLALNKD